MLSIVLILSQLLLGYKIISFFRVDIKSTERFLYALVTGFMSGGWLLLISYLFFGLNTYSVILPAALMLLVSKSVLLSLKIKQNLIHTKSIKKKLLENKYPVAFFFLLLVFFSYISYTHLLEPKDDGLYSAGYTWADLVFHTGIINAFAEGTNPDMEYLIYVGVPLHYHFMVDFSTAVFVVGGFSLREALIFVNTLFLFSAFLLFYYFARRITKKQSVAVLAIILFVFTGGLGFLHFFEDSKNGLGTYRDYTAYPEKGIHFGNPLTDALFPQRGYLIGYPALFILLAVLRRNLTERFDRRELAFAGLVVGLLPLFHLYAFFSAVFIYLTLFAVYFYRDRKKLLGTWPFFAIAGILSLPQMYWYFHKAGVGFVKPYLGWLAQAQGQNWLIFWVYNLGALAVLALPAYLLAGRELKKFALPFIGLFAIGNVFNLQPNTHYNITLFYIWNIVNVILIGLFLERIFDKGVIHRAFVIVAVFLSAFSGFLSLAWEAQSSWREFDNEEVGLAEWVKESTPKDSVFLTSTAHNHFVHALAGRRILMGYRGSLWSHAIDYGRREKDVDSMFRGTPEAIELLKKYNVKYVVIGPGERSDFSINEEFFAQNMNLVKESRSYKIYSL